MTNQDWNDQTNNQGQNPEWGQAAPGDQTPPPAQGYDASASYGQSAPGDYNQGAYGQGGYEPQGADYGAAPAQYGYGQTPAMGYPQQSKPLATWPKRALGALIDYVVPGFVIGLILNLIFPVSQSDPQAAMAAAGPRNVASFVLGLLLYVVLAYLSSKDGQTPGRKIAKTRLVSEATGQPLSFGTAILRYLCHYLDSLACLIGWLFPLWDTKRQTFADKIMKSVVVDESAPLQQGYPQQ